MELAKEFSSLTELVKSNARVACECALTAFSLSPTSERYETLDALQQLLPEIDTQPYSEAAAKNLGISNSVIKDLSVVVHSCRWEVLTWKNGWSSLSTLCIEYLVYPEKMRNITKDLKFLNSKLDYSQFDHLPKPEVNLFTGIEKGYEDYIHDIDIEIFSPVAGQRSKRKKTSKHRVRAFFFFLLFLVQSRNAYKKTVNFRISRFKSRFVWSRIYEECDHLPVAEINGAKHRATIMYSLNSKSRLFFHSQALSVRQSWAALRQY